ncbi:MAG: hypothetical protein ACRDFY_04430, partial [Candidatus Limnocylindria bacterium]
GCLPRLLLAGGEAPVGIIVVVVVVVVVLVTSAVVVMMPVLVVGMLAHVPWVSQRWVEGPL